MFEVARTGLSGSGRYGNVASVEAPLVTARFDQDRAGIALVAPEGRLLVWSDGVLRAYDVGSPLSRFARVLPITVPGRQSPDVLAIAQDGAAVLIAGVVAGGPRVVARLDVHALLDGQLTLADLDGDGNPEAVILSDPTSRSLQGAGSDERQATSVAVIGLKPNGLDPRGRVTRPPPGAFETLGPVATPLLVGARSAAVLLVKRTP